MQYNVITKKDVLILETTTITFRIPKEEKLLVSEYAKLHHISLTELYRKALLEQIEDEVDLETLRKAMDESKDDNGISQEDMEKLLNA